MYLLDVLFIILRFLLHLFHMGSLDAVGSTTRALDRKTGKVPVILPLRSVSEGNFMLIIVSIFLSSSASSS